jgi:TolA-binding protein
MAEADTVFAKLLESGTDRIGVYFEVADYYRDRQNTIKMGEAIAAAGRIDADDRRMKYYRGVHLIMAGKKLDEAESLLRTYIRTVPDNADLPSHATALEWLGKLRESQGKFSEAAEDYRLSMTLDPHNKTVEEAYKRVEKK